MDRRTFLRGGAGAAAALPLAACTGNGDRNGDRAAGQPATGSGEPTTRDLWANVRNFGARGDGSDDTRAIQAAIDAIKHGPDGGPQGGVVFFPRGEYACDGPLVLNQTYGVTLMGEGGPNGGFMRPPASLLTYRGSTAERFIDARETLGTTLIGLGIRYMSKDFTGVLVDLSAINTLTGTTTTYCVVERCNLGGGGATPPNSAAILVNLHNADGTTIRNCHLAWGQSGIVGRRGPDYGFSNAHLVEGCTFDSLRYAGILNPGQAWVVSNCTFEGTKIGGIEGTAMLYGIRDDTPPAAASQCHGLVVQGCWFGDVSDVAHDAWIKSEGGQFLGLSVTGNLFGGYGGTPGNPADAPVRSFSMKFAGRLEGAMVAGNSSGSYSGLMSVIGGAAVVVQGNTRNPSPEAVTVEGAATLTNSLIQANNPA